MANQFFFRDITLDNSTYSYRVRQYDKTKKSTCLKQFHLTNIEFKSMGFPIMEKISHIRMIHDPRRLNHATIHLVLKSEPTRLYRINDVFTGNGDLNSILSYLTNFINIMSELKRLELFLSRINLNLIINPLEFLWFGKFNYIFEFASKFGSSLDIVWGMSRLNAKRILNALVKLKIVEKHITADDVRYKNLYNNLGNRAKYEQVRAIEKFLF